MFDFTAVLTGTNAMIGDSLSLIDPSTLVGGLVTVFLVSLVMVSTAKRVVRLVRR